MDDYWMFEKFLLEVGFIVKYNYICIINDEYF